MYLEQSVITGRGESYLSTKDQDGLVDCEFRQVSSTVLCHSPLAPSLIFFLLFFPFFFFFSWIRPIPIRSPEKFYYQPLNRRISGWTRDRGLPLTLTRPKFSPVSHNLYIVPSTALSESWIVCTFAGFGLCIAWMSVSSLRSFCRPIGMKKNSHEPQRWRSSSCRSKQQTGSTTFWRVSQGILSFEIAASKFERRKARDRKKQRAKALGEF